MRFYTNVCRIGNNICVREQTETGPHKYKVRYEPTLYLKTDKESEYKTLYGDFAKPRKLDSMSSAKEFMEQYKGVSGVEVYGQQNWVLQFINETYSADMQFDPKQISAWSLDIETKLPTDETGAIIGFPDVETANAEITLITVQSLSSKQCFTFGSREYKGTKVLDSRYLNCGSESELLKQFVNFWQLQSIEVITGWNIERFDIPFIVNRIKLVLGDEWAKKLSPWELVNVEKKRIAGGFGGEEEIIVNIAGVSILDYMALYKKFVFVKHESYSLGFIAQEELGETKLDHSEYANFNEFYEKGFDLKFVDYNIRDTQLVARLEDKLKLIELVYTLSYLAKINHNDVFSPVKMWDAILHNRLLSENTVVPLKENNPDGDKHIEGAYVKDPMVGMHEWIVSLDATSLYPSIMMTLNISPETYQGIDKDFSVDKLLAGTMKLNPPEFQAWGPNGARFDKTTRGVIPKIIEEMMAQRKSAKKKMLGREQDLENAKKSGTSDREKTIIEADISALNNLQMALKIGLNSLYGATGNKGFRFFNSNVAETITLTGQFALRSIEKEIDIRLNKLFKTENHRYLVYVDTDSVYFNIAPVVSKYFPDLPTPDKIKRMERMAVDILQKQVNEIVDSICEDMNVYENKLSFKLEACGDRAIWLAKKKYVVRAHSSEGVTYAKPKYKTIGLELVRSSTPMFIRKKLKDLLPMVFDTDEATIQKYLAETREEFDKLQVHEIAFPRGANGLEEYSDPTNIYKKGNGVSTPIHVRAALLYNSLIKKHNLGGKYPLITTGGKLKFVYLKLPNTLRENVVAFPADETLPIEFDLHRYVDKELQWEKTMIASTQIILDAIGWDAIEQSSLEDFFG
jgi:DNA polymerase elongation subunit (family B)